MPNQSSNAGHQPVRTCVVCRTKKDKMELLRFIRMNDTYVIDCRSHLIGRGYYLCDENDCIVSLDKWLKRKHRKREKNRDQKDANLKG